jgi:hypothetical protein
MLTVQSELHIVIWTESEPEIGTVSSDIFQWAIITAVYRGNVT